MEENQPKVSSFILKFGLISGLISVAFGLMLYFQGLHYERGIAVQAIPYVILAIAIVIGIIQFKKANSSYLKLGQALKLGAGIGLISALIGTIYFLVLSNVIEPDFMANTMEIAKTQAFEQNPKLTEEQWDQGAAFQAKFFPVFLAAGLVLSALYGLIIGLFTGLVTKKDNPA